MAIAPITSRGQMSPHSERTPAPWIPSNRGEYRLPESPDDLAGADRRLHQPVQLALDTVELGGRREARQSIV